MARTHLVHMLLAASFGVAAAPGASADIDFGKDGLTGTFGKVQLRGNFSASVQGALIDPLVDGGRTQAGRLDGSARLTLEYTTDNAILIGVVGELDSGNNEIDGFERDEIYAYLAADWGRIEVGENDGPADTLSFFAPATGLGQVRGDFARYQGSIALFTPYDTRDAAKITYLSPPVNGFRGGVSYAPEFNINEDDPDPTRRLLQNDVVELAGQYNTVALGTTFGVSTAYVTGTAQGLASREDIESWSVGVNANRGKVTVGGAYVDRGRSNLLATSEPESEWNAGLAYRADRWSLAASTAITEAGAQTVSRFGLGGTFDLTETIYVASDVVFYEESAAALNDRNATVGIVELGIRF